LPEFLFHELTMLAPPMQPITSSLPILNGQCKRYIKVEHAGTQTHLKSKSGIPHNSS
jgi:hypothetical protein